MSEVIHMIESSDDEEEARRAMKEAELMRVVRECDRLYPIALQARQKALQASQEARQARQEAEQTIQENHELTEAWRCLIREAKKKYRGCGIKHRGNGA